MPSQVSELLDRDITPDDYEMLLQLDESVTRPTASRAGVERLAGASGDAFLGENCAICLLAFEKSDEVKVLPCTHFFHQECVARWLLERCRCCPLCGDEALPPAAP